MIVLRVEAGLFFANSDHVRRVVLAHAGSAKTVVLDAETIPFVDVTAAEMLRAMSEDLERRGVRLLVARDVGQVRDVLGDEAQRVYPTVEAAVTQAR